MLFKNFELSGRWSGRTKRRAAFREFLPLYAIPTQRPKKAAKRTGGARKGSANLTRRQKEQRGSKRNAPALQEPKPTQIQGIFILLGLLANQVRYKIPLS